MAQTKATKKFEKKHLKDTLERRKGLKKIKQKQQLKSKKKAFRAEENGNANGEDGSKPSFKQDDRKAFQDMTVDDFFQGGFDIPQLPKKRKSKTLTNGKRKRHAEEEDAEEPVSDGSIEKEHVQADNDSDASSEQDMDDFKQQLEELAEKDPEFHRLLQTDEPEVFEDLDNLQLSEDDDETEPKRKKQKRATDNDSDEEMEAFSSNELTVATVKKWRAALLDQHSLRASKEVVIAFRAATRASSSDPEEKDSKYSISDPDVYHQLLTTALDLIPKVFQHHIPVSETKSGKVRVATESKKFKTLSPLLRSQITATLHLLEHLSDAATLRLTLCSALPLLPYLLSFKKLIRDVAKAAAEVFATPSNAESVRISAFAIICRLNAIGDPGIRENVLKATYQAMVKSSRNVTFHTMPGLTLMKERAALLWDPESGEGSVAYTTAFTFIRSLAVLLRNTITHNANESYKNVYNWQYVNSLDFWSRVIASNCTSATSPLRPLIYPLVQVTLGALRLIPTATYFPLRFHLIRSLLRISLTTGTYIPLAAPLYEVLASAEMRKPPKPSTVKPIDFNISIRAPQSYLHTRIYQDGVGEQVQELLSEFFVVWAKSIAFPELALPVNVMLKRWLKDVNQRGGTGKTVGNKNTKVNSMIQLLVQKLEANARWIEERRAKVDFAPNNRKGVESFLEDVAWEKTPLGAFVVGQRKTREERIRSIEEGRKEEENRRDNEKKAKANVDRPRSESESESAESGEDEEMFDDDDEVSIEDDDE